MDGINLIQDLAIVLLAAGLAGALCKRIGLSVIVGYLLAGIIVGPHTPPFSFIIDINRIETLSQLGLIFLMFAIGLGLSLTRLQRMGLPILAATGLAAFFVLNLTHLLGKGLGWTATESIFIAAMFMVSSSAVIANIIRDMNLGHERSGQLALGVTVLEDVVAVVMLAVLGSQITPGGNVTGMLELLIALTAFVVLLVMAGLFLIHKLFRRLEIRADPELQTIAVAGVLFLMALLGVKAGYSLALGAFLLGAIVAEMPQKGGVDKSFSGLRDIFSSVFFVSIGMMIDLTLMFQVWPWILGLGVFTMVVRAMSTGLALILVGMPPQESRRAGLVLMPLGEFTFVIAQMGVAAQVLAPEYYPMAIGISMLTVLATPVINRHCEPLLQMAAKLEPKWLQRCLTTYYLWIAQLGNHPGRYLWWQVSRKRVMQTLFEVLFVTGLLIFSERLLSSLQGTAVSNWLTPVGLKIAFWSAIALLVSVPLVAIWRNVAATASVFAEAASKRTRFLGPIVENGVKAFCALAIIYWFSGILPTESLSNWIWLGIAAALAAIIWVFSRRLILLQSQWESSLREALSDNRANEGFLQVEWAGETSDWDIHVQELLLPEAAACAGKSLAELLVRSRFGCSIVEINRQGHTIVAPEPTERLFSGDRLLLLGTLTQIAAARSGFTEIKPEETRADFDVARLEMMTVPPGAHIGLSLAELEIPRHTGVLVVGIERKGEKIISPFGQQRLFADDELLVLGSPEQIRKFRTWLFGTA